MEASQKHQAPLERLSFKGSVDAVRQFSGALAQARSKQKRQALLARLLEVIADDAVPRCQASSQTLYLVDGSQAHIQRNSPPEQKLWEKPSKIRT